MPQVVRDFLSTPNGKVQAQSMLVEEGKLPPTITAIIDARAQPSHANPPVSTPSAGASNNPAGVGTPGTTIA